MDRKSISEGLFESKLASAANCIMKTGNIYMIMHEKYDGNMYIYCDDEYMYIGPYLDLIEDDET